MRRRIPGALMVYRLLQRRVPHLTCVALGFAGGAVVAGTLLTAGAATNGWCTDTDARFRLMAEAWDTIQRVYVDRAALVPTQLTYGAIRGMVDALGDTGHSRFLTPAMLRIQREVTDGTLEGIGAEVQMTRDQVVIVAPLDGSPAQRADLRPGDIILKVNGEPVSGLSLDQVVARILGPANTGVDLTVLTPSVERTRDVSLVRARIRLHTVTWHRVPGTTVAHVRIAMFSKGTSEDLRTALRTIRHDGTTAVILDLRNDPGGLFGEAVDVAGQFLARGDVVLEKDSVGAVTHVPVPTHDAALALPMVGLINGGTASGAEIVAGALKDAHRATLVGETTFGTGTVLTPFPLSDGSALLLATNEWLTPAGSLIWHKGITPDVVVPLPADLRPLYPSAEQGMTPATVRSDRDVQLHRALDLISHREGR
jgi:carboxyl-terminal processing protease